MIKLNELVTNYELKAVEQSDRIKYSYQDYGLMICQLLQLDPTLRGRIMGFLKRTNDGYNIHAKASQLVKNGKILSLTPDEKIRYLIGAYKKSL